MSKSIQIRMHIQKQSLRLKYNYVINPAWSTPISYSRASGMREESALDSSSRQLQALEIPVAFIHKPRIKLIPARVFLVWGKPFTLSSCLITLPGGAYPSPAGSSLTQFHLGHQRVGRTDEFPPVLESYVSYVSSQIIWLLPSLES